MLSGARGPVSGGGRAVQGGPERLADASNATLCQVSTSRRAKEPGIGLVPSWKSGRSFAGSALGPSQALAEELRLGGGSAMQNLSAA